MVKGAPPERCGVGMMVVGTMVPGCALHHSLEQSRAVGAAVVEPSVSELGGAKYRTERSELGGAKYRTER